MSNKENANLIYEFPLFSENDSEFYIDHKIKSEKSISVHTHEFAEIVYIWSGTATHIIDGKTFKVKKGSLLFVNYHQQHEITEINNLEQTDIAFSPSLMCKALEKTENYLDILTLSQFSDLHRYNNAEMPFVELDEDERKLIELLIENMLKRYQQQPVGSHSFFCGGLQIIFSIMVRHISGGVTLQQNLPDELLDYISKNYNRNINASELARLCSYTPAYFGTIFRKACGISFKSYIRKLRMEQAEILLKNSNDSIEEISDKIGFTSKTEFYKCFTELYGMTPLEFRKNNQTFKI